MSLLSTVALSLWSLSEYRRIHHTIEEGTDLIADARRVHVLMKDMLVGVFTPRTFGLLKDVVHLETLSATRRFWISEAVRFQSRFRDFMFTDRLRAMVAQEPLLQSQYQVAIRLGEEAFAMIHTLERRLAELDDRGLLGTEDLYQQIQRSEDPAMIQVFNEIRETSFFLSNSFESFLHHFIESLQERARVLQERVVVVFVIVAALMTGLSVLIPSVAAGQMIRNVRKVAAALRDVAKGDFSVKINIQTRDEFAVLAADFNSFVDDLQRNVEALIGLQRRLQDIAIHEADVSAVLQVVTDNLVHEEVAEWASIRRRDGSTDSGVQRILAASGAIFDDPGAQGADQDDESDEFVERVRFDVPNRISGHLVVGRAAGLNDLQRTAIRGYAEFAALVVENHYSYAELIERRSAQFQALEAQIRPHFLYNVLNNIVGLNRLGDRKRLESSVLSLKELLRHSLDSRPFVPLRDELRVAERYCELQRLRFGDRLHSEVVLPQELGEMRVPGLIVQPLVENAIIHGIEPKENPGTVSIRAEVRDARLVIEVRDDGVGFVPGPINRSDHIGLTNVRERLRLAYVDAALEVTSAPGKGTTCSISIALPEVAPCAS